ncbi:hypothetical protein POJ06DRAFT_234442 [Lipomyces tetrasporus]|uniref:BZIP domain-containing protein n=1 Tax=Lipomyces tetrasporus TaxID=54092 RepID=A0AAD7QXT0_9ASCO|nr:uncharacterized protein POJ06DRAFT_234442 [Lipomyces tetrasporus]KAJ8103422.1 hypothetical protein POJ06DRAFT_234442 [Lipomyces tetrasporus]
MPVVGPDPGTFDGFPGLVEELSERPNVFESPSTHSISIKVPSPTSSPNSSTPPHNETPNDTPARVVKRQLNTLAARRYRQRRLDQVKDLEAELRNVQRERDELRMRVSKLEGETEVLKSLLGDQKNKRIARAR